MAASAGSGRKGARKYDFPARRFGRLPVKYRRMADHAGPVASGLAADGLDQFILLLFFLVFDKLHLDQFMFFQGSIDRCRYLGRQTIFADQNHWFESMGQTSEVFVLVAGQLL